MEELRRLLQEERLEVLGVDGRRRHAQVDEHAERGAQRLHVHLAPAPRVLNGRQQQALRAALDVRVARHAVAEEQRAALVDGRLPRLRHVRAAGAGRGARGAGRGAREGAEERGKGAKQRRRAKPTHR